ncbi:hypothetical protein Asera_06410 [Actinocatenispora sera]|uniref:Uncharacterized protein n=1 Tax=Actinocatenispora sera TaxID=390989 RepID=A0A810KTH7_9ACTN|nr:hypothetical protein Asera_06410 [Actinocatenispora sera]
MFPTSISFAGPAGKLISCDEEPNYLPAGQFRPADRPYGDERVVDHGPVAGSNAGDPTAAVGRRYGSGSA